MERDGTVKRLLETAAAPQPAEPDLEAIARRVARGRRRRRAAALLAVAPLVLVAVAVLARTPQVVIGPGGGEAIAAQVPLPAEGEATALWLDGMPVLVVNARGAVHAVEAVAPYRELGVGDAIAWCRPAGMFVSVHAADRFAPDGGYLGGPSPTGLPTYGTSVSGDMVSVGERRAPAPRSAPPPTPVFGDIAPCVGPDEDPDAVVQHDWPPAPGTVVRPQEAAARGGAERLVVSGRLLLERGAAPRLCEPEGGPTDCHDRWLPVAGLEPLGDRDIRLIGYEGLWRVDVVDGTATDLVHLRTDLVAVEQRSGGPQLAPSPGFGQTRETVVHDGVVQVPAVDLAYGRAPAEPLAAGTYEFWLDNHGGLEHTLVSDSLDLVLVAAPGQRDSGSADLPAGEHVLYCRLPGHREAGMELLLVIGS